MSAPVTTVKRRRCNLWDDNGKGRLRWDHSGKGCPKDASACHFAHPHERVWDSAQPSMPPPADRVADLDSDFFYSLVHVPSDRYRERDKDKDKDRRDRERDRDRGRERDKEKEKEKDRERTRERKPSSRFNSPPHRKDSATTRASSGASPRRPSYDAGSSTQKKQTSPASSSDMLEQLRKDNKSRTKDLLGPPSPLRQDHAPSPPRSSDKGTKRERADVPSTSPLVASHPPDVQNIVPLEPCKSPPMQPPLPPPQLPGMPSLPPFAQPPAAAKGQKELSMDEQRSAWHERIDLMFTSITSRRDYTRLESELAQIRGFSNSSLANVLSEADRANVNARKAMLELEMEAKRKEINENVQKLVGSQFWPVLRIPQMSEMDKVAGETKKHVLDVKALLDDVKNSCAALFKASDRIQESERPSKRRRIDAAGRSMSACAEDMTEDTAKQLEAFDDKFTELGRHLADLENEIARRDQIISDEIELHVEARLEAEDALYPPVKEPKGVSPTEIEAVVKEKNKELAHAVSVTSEEVGILAVEVAELITKMNALEEKCAALEAENEQFKHKLAQDVVNHTQSQAMLLRREKEVEAIAAALQAFISQAPAGQTALAGDLPSAEYIIESLDSQLDGLFRDKFCSTLVNVQQEVFEKVQESHDRTFNTLSPKIMLLLKMVNLITARLGKGDVDTMNTG